MRLQEEIDNVSVVGSANDPALSMGGAEQFLMVVDLFFESLMFPVCKQLIGVLSCTRGNLRELTRGQVPTHASWPFLWAGRLGRWQAWRGVLGRLRGPSVRHLGALGP